MGKLTLEALLDRKSKQDKMGLATFNVASLNADIEIVKMKTRKLCEIMDKYDVEQDKMTTSYNMMCEVIYKCVPMLQAKDLKETLNVPTPYEVVGELFNINEMGQITDYIMELHGITDKKQMPIDNEIKN